MTMTYIPTTDEPFYITRQQQSELITSSEYVYNLVNQTLINEIKKKTFVNMEFLSNETLDGVNMMRIDYAWDMKGNLKVLELNTAGQQGWIMIKESERQVIKDEDTLSPDPAFLPEFLNAKLGDRIAIISNYVQDMIDTDTDRHSSIEIDELGILIHKLRERGVESKIINFDDNIVNKLQEYNPTGLYWRGNHSMSKDMDIRYKVKIAADIKKLGIQQVPSFEYLFVADDKGFLQYMSSFDGERQLIPRTFNPSEENEQKFEIKYEKGQLVLKPNNASSGTDVVFGEDFDENAWRSKLSGIRRTSNDWVLQERCILQKDGNMYKDLSVYVADGKVIGIISRTSENKIVNVGNGGSLKPVLLLKEKSNYCLLE